ncbi:MAG: hypothetical protein CMP91_06215 [Gammaproteobacteria bacterium]|nr:hypothetical protein [Gammaproteobacteria bacterium]MAY02738.1 hypothetical protein [Gammaproteobacteria bacterium]|tara:strand:+ start:312 stop:629 length:318 start_codon:yes stop_codon:yes gene_type:complete
MRKIIRFLAWLLFLLVVLAGFLFASNNTIEVPLWIGVELAPQSLAVWIILAFAWGGVLGLLLGFGLFRRIRAQHKINKLEARINKLEKQKYSGTLVNSDKQRNGN